MDIIFPVLFFGVMGIVLYVVIKTAAKRKQRFELIARQAGLNFAGGGLSNVTMQGLHEGYPVTFTFTPSGKNTPPYMTASYLCQLPMTVTLRPQGIGTTFKTAFGLGRDLQIGDQTLDDAFEIDAHEDPGLRRFLGDADVRRVLLNIHAHRLCEVFITEQGLSYRRIIDESEVDKDFLANVTEILHWISVLVHRHGTGHLPPTGAPEMEPPAKIAAESSLDHGRDREAASAAWSASLSEVEDEVEVEVEDEVEVEVEDEAMSKPASISVSASSPRSVPVSAVGSGSGGGPRLEPTAAVSVSDLLDLLKQDQLTPEDLASQLQGLGPDAISSAVQGLGDYLSREKLETALLALGPAAVPALVAALEDPLLAYPVTELLAQAGEPMQRALVQELPKITDESALTKALEVCTRCKPAGGAEAIEAFLEHESFLVRYEAERALSAIKED